MAEEPPVEPPKTRPFSLTGNEYKWQKPFNFVSDKLRHIGWWPTSVAEEAQKITSDNHAQWAKLLPEGFKDILAMIEHAGTAMNWWHLKNKKKLERLSGKAASDSTGVGSLVQQAELRGGR